MRAHILLSMASTVPWLLHQEEGLHAKAALPVTPSQQMGPLHPNFMQVY